jgi:hypothetical protein
MSRGMERGRDERQMDRGPEGRDLPIRIANYRCLA